MIVDGLSCALIVTTQWNLQWRLGVAVGNSPTGPFRDIGQPFNDIAGIDPHVFQDDDGTFYLYLNDHQVAKLKPNMIELAEAPRLVDYAPDWVKYDYDKKFEEGTFVFKHGGKYYYTYSNWQEDGPTAYYGIGNSPYGPFDWKGALAGKTESAPDHHSVVRFRGQYYYFYHMDTPLQLKEDLGWYGHRRLPCYDRMTIRGDGTIEEVQRTYSKPINVPPGGQNLKPCRPNPCKQGFTCVNKGNGSYKCVDDPCKPNPCGNKEVCKRRGRGRYVCRTRNP